MSVACKERREILQVTIGNAPDDEQGPDPENAQPQGPISQAPKAWLGALENEQARLQKIARAAAHSRGDQDNELHRRTDLLIRELEMLRACRPLRWRNRFLDRTNRWDSLPPAFQQLKDDNLLFGENGRGYRLQPSANLARLPFSEYFIHPCQACLTGVLLAPVLDVPLQHGELWIEIRANNKILAQDSLPASHINDCTPAQFLFAPVAVRQNTSYSLRVAAREIDAPVRILEWRKWTFLGLGSLRTRIFCGFVHGSAR